MISKCISLYKLYTWSVVFELLLFFAGMGVAVGFGISIARGLQLIFIILYFLASLTNPIYSPRNSFFREHLSRLKNHYWLFLFVSLAGSSFVFLFYLLTGNPIFRIVSNLSETALLRQVYIRPFFEIIIYLYYFWYFVILPHKIFKNMNQLKYFFKLFLTVFNLNLLFGYIDLVGAWFSKPIIPRHLFEAIQGSTVYMGPRFHGFAGEPRHAFVYLALGLAVYLLAAVVFKKKVNFFYLAIILLALVFSQSASGVIGVALFILLVILFGACYGYIKPKQLIFITIFLSMMMALSVYSSEHLKLYIEAFQTFFGNLQIEQFLYNLTFPPMLKGQFADIIPVLYILKELQGYIFFPFLLGHGIGSSSIINNFVGRNTGSASDELCNPNAQIIRLIFEFGVVGTVLFILAMIRPIILLSTKVRDLKINTRIVIISNLAILGCSLAIRSAAPFIFLGIAHVSLLLLKVANTPNVSVGDLSSKVTL